MSVSIAVAPETLPSNRKLQQSEEAQNVRGLPDRQSGSRRAAA
jgi:hypothetical protein